MLFNSISFAIFLPIVFALYWALPHKHRWFLLLISSYYFYMSWNVKYVVLILFTTFVSYQAAILIEKYDDKIKKKCVLAVSIILCLGILFFFKYFNFMSESISNLLNLFSFKMSPLTLKLVLPVGISFYTFQTLSYVIDVYREDVKAERHFGYYATFISFFPQLVAGPIERTSNLLPQIKSEHHFNYEQATYGLKLMAWGFFKKIVIADMLLPYVSKIYSVPQNFYGFALVLATAFFTIQIYCDFSGYSDIAIGTAKLLGINLMTNFNSPYFSQSVKEFWNRWHISLSRWFRDYVYIPLGGNRVCKLRHNFNLMVTFLVSGLWHGANWTFVLWGGVHGVAQIIENIFIRKNNQKSNPKNNGIIKYLKMLLVFIFCAFAWIFFVSNSIEDAFYVINNLFVGLSSPISYVYKGIIDIGLTPSVLAKMVITVLMLFVYDYASLEHDVIKCISNQKIIIRWPIYILFALIILFLSEKGVAAEFIYFQF